MPEETRRTPTYPIPAASRYQGGSLQVLPNCHLTEHPGAYSAISSISHILFYMYVLCNYDRACLSEYFTLDYNTLIFRYYPVSTHYIQSENIFIQQVTTCSTVVFSHHTFCCRGAVYCYCRSRPNSPRCRTNRHRIPIFPCESVH